LSQRDVLLAPKNRADALPSNTPARSTVYTTAPFPIGKTPPNFLAWRSSFPMLFLFGLTLFVSATLLFLVQPMIGKMLLPLLGGTPAVWNTCMVFFQALLLAGYSYAHLTTTWLGVRRQAVLHLGVLLLPLLTLSLTVNRSPLDYGEGNPIPG